MIPFAINHVYVWPPARPSSDALFICNHFPLFQLAHIHIAAPAMSSMTAIIISAYLPNEGMPAELPQGHHI
ncbi:MAG: hypothetical protein LKH61_10045 [Lacticaseibacillus paracasei]|jgi:hypothetical protein|nr:hypothetical protein [Lacticaseibacillus paracasei]